MAADQVQEIKSRIDIVDLVSGYVKLKKAGKNYKGLCPFHSEKTPSFMVSPELQIFKCFGCGRSGDVYSFLQEAEGIEFKEALETLAERAGVKLERRRPSPQEEKRREIISVNQMAQEYFTYLLSEHQVGKKAREYLKNRGIKKETIKKFGLGYAPNSWRSLSNYLLAKKIPLTTLAASGLIKLRPSDNQPYDFFRGRVIFPFFGHGEQIIGFAGRSLGKEEPKYINIGETPAFKKSDFLYGLAQAKSEIKKKNEALVVEGPFDVISPHQAGTKHIVGSQGTALTLGQINLIKRFAQTVTLCYDADFAGDAAVRRAIELAAKRGLDVRVIPLPKGFKDADELAQKEPERWHKAVSSAVSIYDFYFLSTFNRHNPTTPTGKKKIANELLPLIKSIPNDIEREDYLKRLAKDLEIELGVIKAALEKVSAKDKLQEETQGSFPHDPKPPRQTIGLEEYLLALILHAPLDLAQAALHKLGKHDFAGQTALNLFEQLKNYLMGRKRRLDIKVFGAKIKGEEKNLLGELYLQDLNAILETESELELELEKTLTALKKKGLQRRLQDFSKKIREAELVGDDDALASGREEFNKLSAALAKLEEE
jgi:DNA primase